MCYGVYRLDTYGLILENILFDICYYKEYQKINIVSSVFEGIKNSRGFYIEEKAKLLSMLVEFYENFETYLKGKDIDELITKLENLEQTDNEVLNYIVQKTKEEEEEFLEMI